MFLRDEVTCKVRVNFSLRELTRKVRVVGIDEDEAIVGLVLPVWNDTLIRVL